MKEWDGWKEWEECEECEGMRGVWPQPTMPQKMICDYFTNELCFYRVLCVIDTFLIFYTDFCKS